MRLFALAALVCRVAAANPIEDLQRKIDSGEVKLEFRAPRGYLDSVLEALEISPNTQTLVFSKTSAQFRLISPRSPRAIYFNDDVYVGWVRRGPILELSTADPERGAAFYTLEQQETKNPRFVLDNGQCLQCHESRRTLEIPGHLTRSVHPGGDGMPVFRLGTTNVDQTTPLAERFGGWFVTGAGFPHLGNRLLTKAEDPEETEPFELSKVIRLEDYLRPTSDVVAHMLLVHQTQMHNRIAHATLEARKALAYRDDMAGRFGEVSESLAASVKRRIERPAEELLRYMLFADEAEITGEIEGSALLEEFRARGGMYELDLERRLLKTPISYLVMSESFDALPEETMTYIRLRLREVLPAASPGFEHLTTGDQESIQQLLSDYRPSLIE